MAHAGERLLAFGYHRLSDGLAKENFEKDIVFRWHFRVHRPATKKKSEGPSKTCQEAGIKVIMITGDHPETAKTIAGQVGINSSRVLTGGEIAKMSDADLKEALKEHVCFCSCDALKISCGWLGC